MQSSQLPQDLTEVSLCFQVIWRGRWNGWTTTRRSNNWGMRWRGFLCGRETSVPLSPRSVLVFVFACVYRVHANLWFVWSNKYLPALCVQIGLYVNLKSSVFIRQKQLCSLSLVHNVLCFGLSVSLHVKRWKYFLHTWVTASLSESETSPKGCHPGESHFSQKSAARRETTAHRCSELKHGLRALPFDYLSQISLVSLRFVTREHKACRCLSVPVWWIPADHKDKEKQEGASLCTLQTELNGAACLLVHKSHVIFTLGAVSCVEGHRSRAESPEAAAEPGAGSSAEGGNHLHCGGSTRLPGSTSAQKHWSAQCLK